MKDIATIFGEQVFNNNQMRERLPKDIYKALQKTMLEGTALDIHVANIIAASMKIWAVEKGATHYTHWFQPMTGITAEKHDSFIEPDGNGNAILEFSGSALVKGESDASAFPSGGLRATFEARGYTAWDPTSYAFVKDSSLYIPTAFYSYGGEALDKKTPLLRSMQTLDTQSKRILSLFGGEDVLRVFSTTGAEQEYFLIDKDVYLKRPDLIYAGRTLFGSRPPKGQELDDHYFGFIKERVRKFMTELDYELWRLGVFAKTKHNESAPGQHELAPIFTSSNISSDHNQLIMELMKSIADKHNLVCLLHEKPFYGVSGSGKHCNWSMATDKGVNLLEPGDTPHENAQFLLFVMAVIKAVDQHQDLLRLAVASAGNDCRLGGHEAPPAIMSIYLGSEITNILNAIETGKPYINKEQEFSEIGVDALPNIPLDSTDRNRTSPFAFTGNRFEFRMLGSSFSVAGPIIFINTMVAEALSDFADVLEKSHNFHKDLNLLIQDTIKKHKRIIFNGNNYSDEWAKESEKLGLLNLKTTPEALPYWLKEKNIQLFNKHKIFSKDEICSRFEIMSTNYCKVVKIEAFSMIDIVRKHIIPSSIKYEKFLAESIIAKKSVNPDLNCKLQESLLEKISELLSGLGHWLEKLEIGVAGLVNYQDIKEKMNYSHDIILYAMNNLRVYVDQLEVNVSKEYWSLPTYGDILFSVI